MEEFYSRSEYFHIQAIDLMLMEGSLLTFDEGNDGMCPADGSVWVKKK